MSENHVQQALKNIREKKKVTTVTIAHKYDWPLNHNLFSPKVTCLILSYSLSQIRRLTTIIDSDAIALVNQGSIAELGDHLTLLNKEGGIYQSLCETQGITPSNPGTTTDEADTQALPNVSKGASSHSGKTQADLSELENGQKDDAEDVIENDD